MLNNIGNRKDFKFMIFNNSEYSKKVLYTTKQKTNKPKILTMLFNSLAFRFEN
jgi:hypothetical protein